MRETAGNSSRSFPMATEEFIASISPAPVEDWDCHWGPDPSKGAEIRFLGVVRGTEEGRAITGIDYSCYQPMAERELAAICRDLLRSHPEHGVLIHHRTGFVPAGVASLLIRVRTPHSAEAFDLAREYLKRIKSTVPVWKAVRFA